MDPVHDWRLTNDRVLIGVNGKTLPNLPPSMVQMLSNGRRTNAQTIYNSLVARSATHWVIQGSDVLRFQVTKNKRVSGG